MWRGGAFFNRLKNLRDKRWKWGWKKRQIGRAKTSKVLATGEACLWWSYSRWVGAEVIAPRLGISPRTNHQALLVVQ